jgi:hypothetical protein
MVETDTTVAARRLATARKSFSYFVTSVAAPAASAGAFAGWDLHPLESAALSHGAPNSDIPGAACGSGVP